MAENPVIEAVVLRPAQRNNVVAFDANSERRHTFGNYAFVVGAVGADAALLPAQEYPFYGAGLLRGSGAKSAKVRVLLQFLQDSLLDLVPLPVTGEQFVAQPLRLGCGPRQLDYDAVRPTPKLSPVGYEVSANFVNRLADDGVRQLRRGRQQCRVLP